MHHILPSDPGREGRLREWAAARDGWQAYLEEVARLEAADPETLARDELEAIARGLVAEDVRTELRRGARTIARIAEDLTISHESVLVVVLALVVVGEARVSVTLEQLAAQLPKRVFVELA